MGAIMVVLEIRYCGDRLGTMQVEGFEEAKEAAHQFIGPWRSDILWPDGTEQLTNSTGHSMLIYRRGI